MPVNTSDSSNAGYIVAAHSPTDAPVGPRTKVMAWHIVVNAGSPVLVQDGDLTVQSYNVPPPIPQPGPTLDSLDARLTQAVGHRDPDAGNAEAVWTQHTVVSSTSRSVVRWYEFIPSQLRVRQQGEVSSPTDYLFNAAISPSILGNDAALFYDRANASLTPVIGAVSRTHADPLNTMGSELLIGSSVAADTDLSCNAPYGPPCRWGDYSGASPDPNIAGVVWGSNQLNGPTFFGYPQWASRNFAVSATVVPDFSLNLSPTGRAITPGGSATYVVGINRQGGLAGSIALSVTGLPAGATAVFSTNPATSTSTLTINTSGTTPAGTSRFTVIGVSGSISHSAQGALVINSASTYATTIMGDGPSAYWRLGETVGPIMVDSTSNANNGAYAGGVTFNAPGAIAGDSNGAVRFDGSSGYGRAPNSPSLSLIGAVSVETWVNWTAIPTTTQDLVNKGDGATAAGSAFMLGFVSGCSGCGLGFYAFSGNGFACACMAGALPAGSWHHLVGTRTAGGQLAFYVDGSPVASASDGGGALNTVPAGVGVGATGSGSGASLYPANATLDETAIYPTALSAAQVGNHYQAAGQTSPLPGPPTGVSATAGNNQAAVSWTAPAGTITGYVATAYAGTTAKNATAMSGTTTSATLYGLQGGVAYTIQVRAMNSQGTGAAGTSNAVTPTGAPVTYASTVLGDGPALYYRLSDPSGTVSPDSSGNGNTGTYGGGFAPNQPGAVSNDPDGAVLLNGSTGNIRARNSSSLSLTGAISVETWVKWTTTPTTTQDLVNKGDGATATGTSYMLGYVPGCAGCGLGFYTFIGNAYTCACQAGALPAASWYHLVGARTAGGQLAFYINGSQVASAGDGGGALNTVPAGVGVGATGSGSGSSLYPANAALDDTAIYPFALSATQVSNHFLASGNASPPGAPTNVAATAGLNQASVTWTAPAGSVTAYIATAYDGTSARNSVAVAGTAGAATLYGLRGTIPYTVQVRAINANGTGPAGISNAVTPSGGGSTYASTVLADGPNLYYRLGDPSGTIAPDSSGTGNTGTYFGGATLNQPGAILNDQDGAVRFDGSTGFARTPSSTSLSLTGAISVEVWTKWAATPTTTQDLVSKGDGATATGSAYMLAYVAGCGGCGLGFYTFIGNSYVCACQAGAPAAGQWFHLVGTRTASGQLAFYINGSLVAAANDGGGALNSVPSGVGIGATGGGSGSSLYPTNATFDEAAVYAQALSATQVSAHYHAGGY
ncbi:MAG TPA: LamG-like jellyroll fold domain-containing protein [Candidatus Dormibacteraeota bacterium]|nr:LamG-like jellyroll fold domain-containing protein [Candidatus Dormibacteraeota bacterium]